MSTLNVIYKIAADISGLQSGVDRAAASTEKLATMAENLKKRLTQAFEVAAIVELGNKFLETTRQLQNMSDRTGISTDGLQKLDFAFKESGVGIDAVANGLAKLSKNLIGNDKSAVDAMGKLGLNLHALKQMSPEDMFIKVADAVGGIANPTEKAYAAVKIFGKGGAELLAGLTGHLGETTKHFEDMGLIIDAKTVKAGHDFSVQLELLGSQLMALVGTLIGPLLPALSAIGAALLWIGQNVIGPVLNVSIKTVITLLGLFWEALATMLAKLADLATKVPIVGKHLTALGDASAWLKTSVAKTDEHLVGLWKTTDQVGDSAKKATPALIGLGELPDGPLKTLLKSLEDMQAKLTPLPGHFVLISAQVKVFGSEAAKLVDEANAMGVKVPKAVHDIAAAWNATEVVKLMATTAAKWIEDLNKFIDDSVKKLEIWTGRITAAILANAGVIISNQNETSVAVEHRTLSQYQFQLAELDRWVKAEKNKVDTHVGNWQAAYDAIEKSANEKLQLIAGAESVATMKSAVEAAGAEVGKGFVAGFLDVIDQIPSLLKQALTGGGGLKGAGDAIGTSLGAILGQSLASGPAGQKISDGLAKLFNVSSSAGAGAIAHGVSGSIAAGTALAGSGAFGTAAQYATAGASIGFMIGGPIGAGIGAAIGGGVALIEKIFGKDPEKQINPIRQAFVDTAGGLGALNAKAADAGVTLTALLNAKNPEQYKKAIDDLNAAFDREQQLVASLNGQLSTLLSSAQGLGMGLPKAFDPVIQQLLQMGKITADNAALFSSLTGQTGVDFKKMQEVAQKYGIDLASLGPQFQSARLHDSAANIINDFDLLTRGGADVGGVLFGMKDKISGLVQDSLKFGVDIPNNMKPWIEELARSGNLVDENGNKITDLSGIKFSDPIVTEFQKIVNKIQELIDKLGKPLEAAIKNIPKPGPIDVDVNVHYRKSGDGIDDSNYASRGGLVTRNGIKPQYLGSGGNVLSFPSRGTDTVPAMLTPGEFVVSKDAVASMRRNRNNVTDMSEVKAMRQSFERLERQMMEDSRRNAERTATALIGALAQARGTGRL